MRTIIFFACIFFLSSCQKEIILPIVREESKPPVQIVEPDSEVAPEEIFLYKIPEILNSQKQYKLVGYYTDKEDLWSEIPEWVKDDVHIFHDMGDGLIKSENEACPSDPFTSKELKWQAFADDEGVKLNWVDIQYKATTFFISSIKAVTTFTVYQVKDTIKIYSVFESIGK